MSRKQFSPEEIAQNLFPDVNHGSIKYASRLAWFRYAFFITTASLFFFLFLFSLVFFWLNGQLNQAEGVISAMGVVVSPLLPGLYWLRYRRGGYLVNESSLYLKEGFLFGTVKEVPLRSIKKFERISEKRMNLPQMAHFRLQLKQDERFILDVKNPSAFQEAIGRR